MVESPVVINVYQCKIVDISDCEAGGMARAAARVIASAIATLTMPCLLNWQGE
jgi:hypothetical protein